LSVTSAPTETTLDGAEELPEEDELPLEEPEPLLELDPLDELAEPTWRTDAPSSPHEAMTRANAKTSPNNLSTDECFMFGLSIQKVRRNVTVE
jgi:hypothetical protein